MAINGDAIVSKIKTAGGEAVFLPIEITNLASIKKLHQDAVAAWGRLDAAINAAGIIGDFGPLDTLTEENVSNVININLTGVIHCMQEQIRAMQANPGGSGGHIVNFSSIYGLAGCKYGSVYSASKFALVGLTKSTAQEYSGPENNILINCINPGVISTLMTYALEHPEVLPDGPMKDQVKTLPGGYATKRFGKVADVNRGVRFLLESPWVTGMNEIKQLLLPSPVYRDVY